MLPRAGRRRRSARLRRLLRAQGRRRRRHPRRAQQGDPGLAADAGSSGPTIAIRRLELGSSGNSHTLHGPPLSEAAAAAGELRQRRRRRRRRQQRRQRLRLWRRRQDRQARQRGQHPRDRRQPGDRRRRREGDPGPGSADRVGQLRAGCCPRELQPAHAAGTATTGSEFPFARLDGDARDPSRDSANVDPVDGGTNFLAIQRTRATSCWPDRSRRSRACDERPACRADDARYPKPSQFPAGEFPAYSFQCIRAQAAAGRPLGVSVRTLDDEDEVVAIENGHLRQVPSGDDGLAATIAKAPRSSRPRRPADRRARR